MDIYKYVVKYGDMSFNKKVFNEIDNLVFSSLVYLNYDRDNDTIENIGREYLKNNRYRSIKKLGPAQACAYKLLEIVVNKKRYKDIIMKDYVFKHDINSQFSAATFVINKYLNYIAFEGTDELISGWKEDGLLACYFPVPSHTEAIKYLDKHIKLFGPDVIVGGHSKGGNLALVSSMYTKFYKQIKIRKIYSNDGPGLRNKELKTLRYKIVKNRYTHFVADYTVVGILLRDEKYKVIRTTKRNVLSHDMSTWVIKGNRLEKSSLSKFSLRIKKNLIKWLDKHSYKERTLMVNNIFKVLEENNINTLNDMIKFRNIIRIMKGLNNVDDETRKLAIELISGLFKKA